MTYKIDFASIPWEMPMKGVRHKVMKQGDRQLRLVEYAKDLEPHWCEKGHIGYVLEGQLEITFENERVVYNPGDGVLYPVRQRAQAHGEGAFRFCQGDICGRYLAACRPSSSFLRKSVNNRTEVLPARFALMPPDYKPPGSAFTCMPTCSGLYSGVTKGRLTTNALTKSRTELGDCTMRTISWMDIAEQRINENITRKMFWGENIMVTRWELT